MISAAGNGPRLLGKLYELNFSGRINEIALQKLIKEAKDLETEDPLNYFYVMGAISCVRNQEKEARKYYQMAFDRFGGHAYTYYNFAVSLSKLGHLEEAKAQAEKALRLSPTTEEIQELLQMLTDALTDEEMWLGIDSETEEEILQRCLLGSESALAKTWDDPEEEEAWADL